MARRILSTLPDREREALVRFYLEGQTAEQIQRELQITETQFRCIKQSVRERFTHGIRG